MEVDPRRLFRFRFKSNGMTDNMAYFVLSDDINKVRLFLKQHNFKEVDSYIEPVLAEEHSGDDEFLLEPYIMKSNSSDKLYTVMTNEHMVYACASKVSGILSDSLVFGDEVIRDDIPIMKIISKLVHGLDHVYVLDHTLCDQDGKPYSSSYDQYIKCGIPNPDYTDADLPTAYDDTGIYESMEYSIIKDKPLPFTIEAYVSYFADLLTDEYN